MRPSRDKLAQDHVRKQTHVDIAAGQNDADLRALEHLRIARDSGIGRSACAFHHRLFDFEQRGDSAFDFFLATRRISFTSAPR